MDFVITLPGAAEEFPLVEYQGVVYGFWCGGCRVTAVPPSRRLARSRDAGDPVPALQRLGALAEETDRIRAVANRLVQWLLLLLNSGGDPELERREIQTLLQRQVDGLLYAAMYHQVLTPPASLGSGECISRSAS